MENDLQIIQKSSCNGVSIFTEKYEISLFHFLYKYILIST